MGNGLSRKVISAFMAVVLAVGMCPTPAFADSGSGGSLGAATLSADTLAGDQAADAAVDEGDDDDESVSVDATSNGTQVYWFYAWRQKTLLIASNSAAVKARAEELDYGWGASWIENMYTGDAKNTNTNPAQLSNSYNSEAQRDSDLPHVSCEKVEVLGTIAPSNMWYWFEDWSALKTLDLSNVNMANTVDYTLMCKNCPALTSVTLPASFATNAANKNVRGMFYGCTNLKTVYCPSTITSVACKLVDEGWWNDDAPRLPEKFDPFYGTNLVGSMGTAYASTGKGDKSYFRTDWGDQGPGYLSGPTATISYSDNGRTHSPDTRAVGMSYTLDQPDGKTGHTFAGWKAANGTIYTAGQKITVSGNLALTAQYEPITYTVSYNANGGSGAPAAQTKTYGTALTLSSTKPTKTSTAGVTTTLAFADGVTANKALTSTATTTYPFTTWNTAANGSGTSYSAGGSYTANANATLYAQWGTGSVSGSAVTLPTPTRTGYTFKGWKDASGTVRTAGSYSPTTSGTLTAQWEANTVKYKVNHYQMTTSGTWPSTPTATEELSGKVGAQTAAAAKTYAGFTSTGTNNADTATTITQVTIPASGTATVNIYYTRNKYTLTVTNDANSSIASGSATTGSYYYGAKVTLKGAAKTGYAWSGWTSSNAGLLANNANQNATIEMPAGNVTMTATSKAATNTAYKVEHYQMNVDGKTYAKADTENKTGTTGAKTAAAAKTYAGFTCAGTTQGATTGAISQATIAADGSTVVKVYYNRNQYQFTLAADANSTTEGSSASGKYYFGTTVTLKGAAKDGYTWKQWESSNGDLVANKTAATTSFTMPAGDVMMTATSVAKSVAYKVEHYQMNVDGKTWKLKETETKSGQTGSKTAAAAKPYAGFTSTGSTEGGTDSTIEQAVIAGDGSTVVKVYYNRNKYQFKLAADEGSTTKGSTMSGSYYYGAIIKLAGLAKAGYEWSHWASSDTALVSNLADASTTFEMPAGDITMTATSEASTSTAYTVVHHKMGLDGTFGKDVVTETKKGATGAKTAAEAEEFPGFTCIGTKRSNVNPVFEQATIAGDGSTVVDLYYKRNTYHLTVAADDNSTTAGSANGTGDYKFGQKVALKGAAKTGSTWSGWLSSNTALVTNTTDAEISFEMPAGDLTMTATSLSKEQGEAAYVVEHYWQNVEDDGFTLHESERLTGKAGEATAAKAKDYAGFTARAVTQSKIAANGKTIVKVYYDRNVYKFTLGSAELADTAGSTVSGSYKFGAEITLKCAAVNKAGSQSTFICSGWKSSNENLVRSLAWDSTTFEMPAGDLTMTPVVDKMAAGNSFFRVQHYQMTVDGKDWKLADEEVVSDIAPGTEVKPAVKAYAGFTAPAVQTATVDKFGSVVVKYYYERNKYDLTLKADANARIDGSAASGKFFFGADVKLVGKAAEGYAWDGWKSGNKALQADVAAAETTITMPAGDLTMTATTKAATDTSYYVEHYQQSLNGGYALYEREHKTGTTGEDTAAAAKGYAGFAAKAFAQEKIAADGKAVVKVYYDRKSFSFTLGACEGVTTDGSFTSGKYLFGQEIRLAAKVAKGFAWEGWSSSDEALVASLSGSAASFTMPAGDVTMTPKASKAERVVTYHKNDGSNDVRSAAAVPGMPWKVADADLFSRAGQTLVGWNTQADGKGVTYSCGADQAVWAAEGDMDLYAVWAVQGKEPRIAKIQVTAAPTTYSGVELKTLPLAAKVFGRDGAELPKDSYDLTFVTEGGIAPVASTGAALGKNGMPLNAGIYTVRAVVTEKSGGAVTGNWVTVETAFSIERAPLSIVAGASQKVAGEDDPELGWFAEGLQGEDAVKPAPSLSREPGEEPGLYVVRGMGAGVVAADGSDRTANYDVTYVDGGLTILEADPARRVEVKVADGLTYKAAELAWDEVLSVKHGAATLAPSAFEVKSCTPLEVTGARLGEKGLPLTAGYYLVNVEATVAVDGGAPATFAMMTGFWVGKAPLTVTAENATKKAGAAEPALTWKVDGLQGGDKVSPEPKLARKAGETAGSYAITASGAGVVDANGADVTGCYEVSYVAGTLTITAADALPAKVEKAIDNDIKKEIGKLTDADPKGSTFSLLQLRYTKATKNAIKFNWVKVKGAAKYVVIGTQCGKKYKYKKLAKLGPNSTTYTYKKLKKGTSYKVLVKAYNNKGKCIATSKTVHVFTKGGKFDNVKKLTLSKKSVSLKAKKSVVLKSKVTKAGKKLQQHRQVLFESSNPKVAAVNTKTGKVTAKKKGSCYIYAYACDGTMAKCKVTVK